MNMLRHIKRNKLKSEIGNNNISEAWYKNQVALYGPEKYCEIRNNNRKVIKMSNTRNHKSGYKYSITKRGITSSLY